MCVPYGPSHVFQKVVEESHAHTKDSSHTANWLWLVWGSIMEQHEIVLETGGVDGEHNPQYKTKNPEAFW